MADEEENECCPLCMEELDITDKTFNACPCGYQVCLWCWHQIKNEYNALCPACRAPYSELSKQKSPLDREDVIRRTKQRKQKEKSERRSASQSKIPTVNRRNLANVRVMQRNLVYIIGLPQSVADDDILRSNECFGQYGKIVKAVVNKSHLTTDRSNATASAYITFANKEDALSCIIAVDGFYLEGSLLRASFGTTKYCNFFLRNMACNNPDCLYLHELGEQDDSFTKDEMQTALHSGKAAFRDLSTNDIRAGTRFPPPPNKSSATSLQPRTGSSSSSALASSTTGATSAAAAASNASADRQAQSAAAIHKLRQQTSTTSSLSSSSHSRPDLRRGNSYSRIVTGFATSGSSSASSASSSPPSSPAPSTATPPLPYASPRDDRKPNLRVDTSVGGGGGGEPRTVAESIVGPLEALKLATGSSSQEPAWAMPFPSPSIGLHRDVDDTGADPVFSPFGLGFDHHHGLRASTSSHQQHQHQHQQHQHQQHLPHTHSAPAVHDPWSSKSMSPMRHSLGDDEPLASRFSSTASSSSSSSRFPMGLNGGGNGNSNGNGNGVAPNGQVSGLSGLSFASIDAIFSHRDDPSDALAGLLGVSLAPPQPLIAPPTTPLQAPPLVHHSSPSIGSGRSSRFAFANQPAPSPQSALRDAPPPSTMASLSRGPPPTSGGLPPVSPYRSLSRHSSFRDPPSSSLFPSHNDPRAFPPLGGQPPPPPLPPRTSHVFARSTSDPFPSSDFMGGGGSGMNGGNVSGNGLAFLQQMLPNVNISYGGDFPTAAPQPPPLSSSNDGWGGGLGAALGGFNTQAGGHSDSGSSFYDPALLAGAPGGLSTGFYGLGGDDDRLRQQQSAFGGSFRQWIHDDKERVIPANALA